MDQSTQEQVPVAVNRRKKKEFTEDNRKRVVTSLIKFIKYHNGEPFFEKRSAFGLGMPVWYNSPHNPLHMEALLEKLAQNQNFRSAPKTQVRTTTAVQSSRNQH